MKVAVCGKGGVGKTFIAAALAEEYVREGHPVLVIDADSSPNVALSLGLSPEDASRITPVAENEDLIRLKTGTEYPGVFRLTFTVEDIISRYAIRTPAGPDLLVMGTVKSMGSGCTCPAHSVIKALLRHLVVDREEFVILDMEAGIEHLGRGTAEHVDALVIVTDANRKSLETAAAIIHLARESDIPDIRIVGNRISGPRQEEILQTFSSTQQVPLAALIPFDLQVAEAGVSGEVVDRKTSPALAAVRVLAGSFEQKRPDIVNPPEPGGAR